jgi:hypothetical protein
VECREGEREVVVGKICKMMIMNVGFGGVECILLRLRLPPVLAFVPPEVSVRVCTCI